MDDVVIIGGGIIGAATAYFLLIERSRFRFSLCIENYNITLGIIRVTPFENLG